MEDCYICYCKIDKIHRLPCNHTLCYNCYIKLIQPHCPFCRQPFTYSADDIKNKPVSPTASYINNSINVMLDNLHISNNNPLYDNIDNHDNHNADNFGPFSRVRRNCNRKRRRDLTFEEVLERRQMIRKRCKDKWMKKEGRLNKNNN